MSPESADQAVVLKIGFYSALITTASIILFNIAIGLSIAGLATRSMAIGASLLLALCFTILLSCLHRFAPENQKIWTQIGLSFAIIYATIASFNYFLQLTVVQQNPSGYWWMTMDFMPNSAFWALEVIAYGLMGLAALFVAPIFTPAKSGRKIQLLFSVNAIFTLVGGIAYVLTADPIHILILLSLGAWAIIFPIGTGLIARFFRRMRTNS